MLRPGGCLVVLSTPAVVPDDASQFWWDVQDDWVAVGVERLDPSARHPDLIVDGSAAGIEASGLFGAPVVERQLFERTFTAEESGRTCRPSRRSRRSHPTRQLSCSTGSPVVMSA